MSGRLDTYVPLVTTNYRSHLCLNMQLYWINFQSKQRALAGTTKPLIFTDEKVLNIIF